MEEGGYFDETCQCCACAGSPIAVSLSGGLNFSSAEEGVPFDLTGNGVPRRYAWPVSAGDGWLALDRNGNGLIDNGRELFGDRTILADGTSAANGFTALAELDVNGDRVVWARSCVRHAQAMGGRHSGRCGDS